MLLERKTDSCKKEMRAKWLPSFFAAPVYIYLMVATEIYLVILFERNYVNLTNNVFLDDKNEVNHMKINLSEAANKLLYVRAVLLVSGWVLCVWPLPWPAHPITKEIAICPFACIKYFWRWLANFSQNYRTNEFLATICTEYNNSRF